MANQKTTYIIKVVGQPLKPFNPKSARGLYWARVQQYKGGTVAELQASINAKAVSQPKRGKLAGQNEPLQGWLSWFTRQGLIQVVAVTK